MTVRNSKRCFSFDGCFSQCILESTYCLLFHWRTERCRASKYCDSRYKRKLHDAVTDEAWCKCCFHLWWPIVSLFNVSSLGAKITDMNDLQTYFQHLCEEFFTYFLMFVTCWSWCATLLEKVGFWLTAKVTKSDGSSWKSWNPCNHVKV